MREEFEHPKNQIEKQSRARRFVQVGLDKINDVVVFVSRIYALPAQRQREGLSFVVRRRTAGELVDTPGSLFHVPRVAGATPSWASHLGYSHAAVKLMCMSRRSILRRAVERRKSRSLVVTFRTVLARDVWKANLPTYMRIIEVDNIHTRIPSFLE